VEEEEEVTVSEETIIRVSNNIMQPRMAGEASNNR
jgi:hypothetical protein